LVAAWASARPRLPALHAVHVHHGLQADADRWTDHCRSICEALAVPLTVIRADARSGPGESPEEVARKVRYQAIESLLSPGDSVLTAQHEDDQAETLMLQLLRGAGLSGLSAMPEIAEFGRGRIVRPLLDVSRNEICRYARHHRLSWIEDPSNGDPRFDRNFLRLEVIPLLKARWPAAARSLARSARHCANAQRQLVDLSSDLFASALLPDQSLSVGRLQQFREADQRLIVREWLRQLGYRMPTSRTLERIVREAIPAPSGRNPVIAWREGQIRRYRDRLMAMPPSETPEQVVRETILWMDGTSLSLPGGLGSLHAVTVQGPGLDPAAWHSGIKEVRFRRGGEKCRLPGREGQHCLKNLYQERGIPAWQRPQIPLIYLNGQLAAVGDLWTCAPFTITGAKEAIVILWDRNDSPQPA
jgi:tRNA(Ile)-lysidine synthase